MIQVQHYFPARVYTSLSNYIDIELKDRSFFGPSSVLRKDWKVICLWDSTWDLRATYYVISFEKRLILILICDGSLKWQLLKLIASAVSLAKQHATPSSSFWWFILLKPYHNKCYHDVYRQDWHAQKANSIYLNPCRANKKKQIPNKKTFTGPWDCLLIISVGIRVDS